MKKKLWILLVFALAGCSVTNYRYCKLKDGQPIETESMSQTSILINSEKTGMEVILHNGSNLTIGKSVVDSSQANTTVQELIPSIEGLLQ